MLTTSSPVIQWLLQGDPAIQYQTRKDLFGEVRPQIQQKIQEEGWGKAFLAKQNANGHWGRKFYQPKWISTHYTLLDLRHLWISSDIPSIRKTINMVLAEEKSADGGINPAETIANSDTCVNGMFLTYACYFGSNESDLTSIIDLILSVQLPDGGFNCMSTRSGATHSSLHTTLSVLEGILEYQRNGYRYRLPDLVQVARESREFILNHQLFCSHRTGEMINPNFLKLYFPSRWYYDILRSLDYFRDAKIPYDPRMQKALDYLIKKKTKDGFWKLASAHPGEVHFQMEQAGKPSRWNTLRALRVLNHFNSLELR